MKVATALATAVLLLAPVQPASAAPAGSARVTPGTVVVNERGAGTWATISATGIPSWADFVDVDLRGPRGERLPLDLTVIDRPEVWEGQVAFSRYDAAGLWRARLTYSGDGRKAAGPSFSFSVKRRTVLSADGKGGRGGGGGGIRGVLRRLGDRGGLVPYPGQKVRLYKWADGAWKYVAADKTDGKGRYSFTRGNSRYQLRFAGTAVNASSVRAA
ncbi:hypothetical protein GCM10027589_02310 [Actinocorallia lasiicapitis]